MLLPAVAAAAGVSALAGRPDLLECRVIVTGTDMRSRPEGLARCVRDVVVKVTGRPDLAEDEHVRSIVSSAPDLVEDVIYLDRMTDIPMHDEQGSRDRPYDLIGHVDPVKLEQKLAAAGLRPWLDRPTLLAVVSVTTRDGERFALAGDGPLGERQRQAILAAAHAYGLRVALPSTADVERIGPDGLTAQALQLGNGGATATLRGSLRWSDQEFGWVAQWRLDGPGEPETWQVRGVSFDDAFKSGVGGAAKALSSHS